MNEDAHKNSWWRTKTKMERILTLLAIGATILVIALIVALCVALSSKKEADICMTPGCVRTASKLLDNLDPGVDPCDDFYNFACGNFMRTSNIPDDAECVQEYITIEEKVQLQLRLILEAPIATDELKPFKLAKNLYKACMNTSLIESRGIQPLLQLIHSLGGWPVLSGSNWYESIFSWQNTVRDFRNRGLRTDFFIWIYVDTDVKNSSSRIIYVDQPTFGVSREFLAEGLNNPIMAAYYKYMVDIAVLLGAPRGRAAMELKESILFELNLVNISQPMEERRNASLLYNPYTIAELQSLYPSVKWLDYINAIIPPGLTVDQHETVIVKAPRYLKEFERILHKASKRLQANYIMWKLVAGEVLFLTEDLRKRKLQFITSIAGITAEPPRWKECTSIASGRFSLAVGSLYVRTYFNENAKEIVKEMVNRIKIEFRTILENVDWMDEATRKRALEKALAMKSFIAYRDELLDDSKLNKYYKTLEIDENKYLESDLNTIMFARDYAWNKLRKPVNKTDWESQEMAAIVDAVYSWNENSIQLTAGILQGFYFSADRPQYMNYGAIGSVIGHEITHGFDDQGRQFDKDGNLVDWWDPATEKAYLKKAKCIIEQYGNFTVREVDLNVNGINTQGENIADNDGLKEAYLAYTKWAEDHGEEPQLPGLQYTPRQMFWISAASIACSKCRPETLKMRIMTDSHSPGEFRVLGPLKNNEDFAKDFQCRLGSPMNPQHKCNVW